MIGAPAAKRSRMKSERGEHMISVTGVSNGINSSGDRFDKIGLWVFGLQKYLTPGSCCLSLSDWLTF